MGNANISIKNVDEVEKCLKNFSNAHGGPLTPGSGGPGLYDALVNANKIFSELNTYWKGKLYIDTMNNWNKNVPIINSYSKGICERAAGLNQTIYDIIYVDRGFATRIPDPKPVKLSQNNVDTDTNKVTTDTNRLNNDLSKLDSYLTNAISCVNTMLKNNESAPWSDKGGRIDNNKSVTKAELTFIKSQLEALQSNIKKQLSDISTAFETVDAPKNA